MFFYSFLCLFFCIHYYKLCKDAGKENVTGDTMFITYYIEFAVVRLMFYRFLTLHTDTCVAILAPRLLAM